eukprot:gnl/TRDRNA2_/TRDRNA2_82832_c0_seq1.p1 gnl/TRDRNA2_/TRDRNA2_82832_c0~~gnl/TRDRNA2_/TRDRNA2_82832_c0_seq1.p1  ORF type:complete len:347 (-),score=51.36 gnl/TRDRNA2_/TRDRNA2_82832_c0_seq1:11-1024(-)
MCSATECNSSHEVREFTAELFFSAGNKLGECPLWDVVRQRLCWLDIEGRRFWELDTAEFIRLKADSDPSAADAAQCFDLPVRAGSFCFCEGGEYVFAFEDGLSFYEPATGQRCRVTEDFEPGLKTRMNDGRVDRQGRFVVGGHVEKGDQAISSVYRLNADLTVERLFEGVRCSNCICFALHSDSMFFADTMRDEAEIWSFPDYTVAAMSAERQVFVRPEGRPDGSAIDSEGCLWNAEFGGGRVVRYLPDGTVDAVVKVPVRYTTCVAFGDHDLCTLYITDASVKRLSKKKLEELPPGYAGGIFRVRVPVPGLPEMRFRGSSVLRNESCSVPDRSIPV